MKTTNNLFSNSFFRQGLGLCLLLLGLIWTQLGILIISYGNLPSTRLLSLPHYYWLNHLMFWMAQASGSYIVVSGVVIALARRTPVNALVAIITSGTVWYVCITIQYNHFQNWKGPAAPVFPNPQIQPELNFPSIHAAVVTCLAIYLAWYFTTQLKYAFIFFLGAIIFMYSRIDMGWAYVSDVLAGSILGATVAIICILWLTARLERWYNRRSPWWQDMIIAILRTAAISTIFVKLKYFIL